MKFVWFIGLISLPGVSSETVILQFVDEDSHVLTDLKVRIETPMGILTTRTNEKGQIEVPTSYPHLVLFLGDPLHLIRVPGVVDLSGRGAIHSVVISQNLLEQMKPGE